MRKLVFLMGLLGATRARAAVFYDNTAPPQFGGSVSVAHEIADDVPFAGAQHVTSFTILHHADTAVNATFKFHGVAATGGGVGAVVKTSAR
jgi:hypothetical protein